MVYRHISPSGRIYIGITKNSTTRRWGKEGNGYKRCVLFYRAIQKYGWDNMKHEVLFSGLAEKKAKYLEVELIRHYKNLGISYNCTDGGDGYLGFHPSQKTLDTWSEKRKGRTINQEWRNKIPNTLKGRAIPHETSVRGALGAKLKCSKAVVQFTLEGEYITVFDSIKEAARHFGKEKANSLAACCKGVNSSSYNYIWMYKTDYDAYVKLNILEKKIQEKVSFYKHTLAFKKSSKYNAKGRQASIESRCLPIQMLSLNDISLQVFPSGACISKQYGYDANYIRDCCRGKYPQAYGYKWKFITKEEYEKLK